ncbi:uncharacterized protein E0L32_011300, partial [Thyridium curvatum]
MSFFQPRQQPNYAPRPAPQPPAAVKAAQVAAAAAAAAQATQYGSEPPMTASASSPLPTTTTQPAAAASPHPQATIVPVAEHHIPALRRINSLLLPVNYPDSFYHKALDPAVSGLFSRVILWRDDDDDDGSDQQSQQQQGGSEQRASDQVIGGIVCRLEPSPFSSAASPGEAQQAIYIQSLALLSPYRGLGLAAAALDDILAAAAAHTASSASRLDVRTAFAHVWTENEDGLAWYLARGFVREGPEPVRGYYFKLRPDTAWVVRREIPGPGPAPTPPAARRPVPQPV